MPTLPNVQDYLNPAIWTGVVRDAPIPMDYIGQQFFPERSVDGDRLFWDVLSSENRLAPFVAPGAESPLMERDDILQRRYAEIAFIRYKAQLREPDVRILREFGQAPDGSLQGGMRRTALAEFARINDKLNASVEARLEWLRISALLGVITVTPSQAENVGKSNISFTVTYPVSTQTASPLWSDLDDSDPYLDMRTWFNALETWTPGVMICSRDVIWNLIRNDNIRSALFPIAGNYQPSVLSQQALTNWLSAELGLRVIVYDAKYSTRTYDADGNWTRSLARFLPANKVIFLPDGAAGFTATAPAPQNNWDTGKFSWISDPEKSGKIDPWVWEMGVGYYGLPILQQPDRVLVATVAA